MSQRSALREQAVLARESRSGDLRHDLALYVALLRRTGVAASPSATLHALEALTLVALDRSDDVRSALECTLTSTLLERAVFDAVYDTFWTQLEAAPSAELSEQQGDAPGEAGTQGRARDATEASAITGRQGADRRARVELATHGRAHGRGGDGTAEHRQEIDELARRLARALGAGRGRRLTAAPRSGAVDLRSTLRQGLRFGGELVELRHVRSRRDRARLVVLCDVSTSMQSSTPLFLAFVHAVTRHVRHVEAAVFNVELSVVTDVLRGSSLGQAMGTLRRQRVALAGGTRIGHCLGAFVDDLERRGALHRDTTAIILSDGWDVGEPDLLKAAALRLHRSVDRVLWCDPHAAATGYRPQVQGLRTALPHVDDHLDFSSVASLHELVTRLEITPSERTRP